MDIGLMAATCISPSFHNELQRYDRSPDRTVFVKKDRMKLGRAVSLSLECAGVDRCISKKGDLADFNR